MATRASRVAAASRSSSRSPSEAARSRAAPDRSRRPQGGRRHEAHEVAKRGRDARYGSPAAPRSRPRPRPRDLRAARYSRSLKLNQGFRSVSFRFDPLRRRPFGRFGPRRRVRAGTVRNNGCDRFLSRALAAIVARMTTEENASSDRATVEMIRTAQTSSGMVVFAIEAGWGAWYQSDCFARSRKETRITPIH